jgi:hypothetical protein
VFAYRLITDTLEYPQTDLFAVFLDLVTYGQTKNSSYIASTSPAATRPAAYLALMASNGGIANLVLPTGAAAISGIPWTASYTYSDETQVSSAWSDMTQSGNFDYAFVPGLDESGNLAIFIQLGYTQLGRSVAEAGYSLTYPGNVIDYGFQRTGSQGANAVWATAAPNGSALQWGSVYPHGFDLTDLQAGYPIMEATVAWQGSTVTKQSQIDSFADGQLPLYSQAMTNPTINVGGGGYPQIKDITLGDAVPFSATSPLHPPQGAGQEPGLQMQVRVTGWTWYAPGPSQSEFGQLTTTAWNQGT